MDRTCRLSHLSKARRFTGVSLPVWMGRVIGMTAAVLLHAILLFGLFTCSADYQPATQSRAAITVQLLRSEPISAPVSPSSMETTVDAPRTGLARQSAVDGNRSAAPSRDEVAPHASDLTPEMAGALDSIATFLRAGMLDRRPLPVSEPDAGMLNGSTSTGLPIKLRLFIGSNGHVVRIDVLAADEGDAQFIERLKQMFFATRYLPGRLNGGDVNAYTDIQLNATPLPVNASSDTH